MVQMETTESFEETFSCRDTESHLHNVLVKPESASQIDEVLTPFPFLPERGGNTVKITDPLVERKFFKYI